MKIHGLKLHRKISWLVAIFSLFMMFVVSLRGFLEIFSFYPFLHLSVEWILIGLLILHCILSQKFLKLWFRRIFKGLKNERARPIYIFRLIQLITNRIIIILAALVLISGLGYYDWYANTIGTVIPFTVHIYYDFFLMMCIIIHIGVGFKFIFMRKKIKQKVTNIFIILFISILIAIILFLTFLP
ncbi:MAG: hypothetical protein ACFE9S_00285 [Candidatus Hermodarchaeota archaeon]